MPEPLRYDQGHRWDTPGLFWDGFVPESSTSTPSHTMTPDDLADIEILAQDITDWNTHMAALKAIAAKYMIGLTAEQRRTIPTIGPERKAMETDFNTSIAGHPEFVQGWVDMAKFQRDVTARGTLRVWFTDLQELCEGVGDTMHALGSDMLIVYMGYYGNVMAAAKRNVSGATTTLGTLQQHIPRGWKIKKTPPPTP
jgi:hypothetical protein